jgi:hypothetical protein
MSPIPAADLDSIQDWIFECSYGAEPVPRGNLLNCAMVRDSFVLEVQRASVVPPTLGMLLVYALVQ